MKIKVKTFATVKDICGFSEKDITVKDNALVADLLQYLIDQYPLLKDSSEDLLFAVNDEYVTRETPLRENDVCALFPPVSGG